MKNILLSAVCASVLTLSSFSVNAQEPKDIPLPPQHHEEMPLPHGKFAPRPHMIREKAMRHHERFAQELGLSEEQKAEAKKIREAGREKVGPLMEEMKQLRQKMDELRKQNMEEFEKILTPEQKTKLEQIKTDKKAMFEKRMAERKAAKTGTPKVSE